MPVFSLPEWGAQLFIFYIGRSAYNFAWWTLSIEVMFYVLAPLLVAVLIKRSTTTINIAFLASVLLALIAGTHPPVDGMYGTILRFLTFISCFSGGLLLAKQDVPAKLRACLVVAGIVIAGAGIFDVRINGRVGYGLIYMALVSHVLVPHTRVSRLLSRPLLVWLGERSYSLFLTHCSVIALACWTTSHFISGKGPPYFLVSRALAVFGSLIVACILFEGVERRFAQGLVTAGMWLPWKVSRSVPSAKSLELN
jgi:peptidoglycan/LPS O-acetylase OafA/YrhL